jgi:hypothetical protein
MANLRRPTFCGFVLLSGRIENDLGERALKSLPVEKSSGAAKIETLLQCHPHHEPVACRRAVSNATRNSSPLSLKSQFAKC